MTPTRRSSSTGSPSTPPMHRTGPARWSRQRVTTSPSSSTPSCLSTPTKRSMTPSWERFSGPIRLLLDNKFVFQPFWNHHAGRGSENWEQSFERSKRRVHQALAARDTGAILSTLFDRLYVLRIQLMHGGASWESSVNRDQVRDGARIMAFLVPIFVGLMMSHPDVDWGPPDYPVVN